MASDSIDVLVWYFGELHSWRWQIDEEKEGPTVLPAHRHMEVYRFSGHKSTVCDWLYATRAGAYRGARRWCKKYMPGVPVKIGEP